MTAPVRAVRQDALADLADIPATSRWVRSGPLALHVLDYRSPDTAGRPTVLVLPGITTPAACVDFVAGRLRAIAAPVVLDLRGRGLSDSADTFTLDDYAADVLAVVDGLELGAPLLLGHSLGARIAAAAAVAAEEAGRPLGGSILVDPPMSGPGRDPYPTTLAMFLGQYDQAVAGTTADEVAASWPRWPRAEQEMRARWLSSCQREALVATHAGFESEDFLPLWSRVPARSVLVHGADSPVVPAAAVAELVAARPDLTVRTVPAAGHMVFWDNLSASMREVTVALDELTR